MDRMDAKAEQIASIYTKSKKPGIATGCRSGPKPGKPASRNRRHRLSPPHRRFTSCTQLQDRYDGHHQPATGMALRPRQHGAGTRMSAARGPRTGVKSELTPLQRHGNEVSDRRVVSPSPCSAPPAWLLDSSSARRPRPRTASATRPRTRHAVLTRPIAHAATLLACLPACLPAASLGGTRVLYAGCVVG